MVRRSFRRHESARCNRSIRGTWVYNSQKSPKPTIRYAIKDLGGGRYALTGSAGVTVEVKADGIPIKTSFGDTISFKKLDDHDREMYRDDGEKIVPTYNVSPDDKTLTLHDVFTGEPGNNFEKTTKYARLSPGNSIFGEWQSISMEQKSFGEGLKLIISHFGLDGLSFSVPADKHLSEMCTQIVALATPAGRSSSRKRVNDRLLQIDGLINGEPEDSAEFTVSDDGKTLTIVSRPASLIRSFHDGVG